MNKLSKRARLICPPIVLAVLFCFVAGVGSRSTEAEALNGRIAFTSDSVIYTINADGSGLLRLTPSDSGFFDRYPAWSPDGTRIAFGRTTFTVQSEIYVMNANGSSPTRLTINSATDRQPTWSPDGTKMAFVSNRDGNEEIYVMNADGTNQTRVTNNAASDFDPAWSPDGTRIAFTSVRDNNLEVYAMNADGSNPVRLTNNSSSDRGPSWAPDGTRIAFTSQRDGLVLVYVMNADGSGQISITQSTTLDSNDPEWSPDGARIAFTSYQRVGQTNADEIFVMNADGSNITRATNTSFDEHDLSWQPVVSAPTPTPSPTPTSSPTPSFTISGAVTNATGMGIADVAMVLLSDVNGTEITFTNQSGNYVFSYSGGHNLVVTPTKSGYSFSPLSIGFVSSSGVSGSQTASFTGTPTSVPPSGQMPILLTQENSLRALALDSVTMASEPFPVTGTYNFSADQRTRVSFLVMNLELGPGETTAVITAQAENSLGQIFTMPVEYLDAVPNAGWLKQLIVQLPDQIANSVEVRVSLIVRGTTSNKVIVKVKP